MYLSLHCCFALCAGVTFNSRETFNYSCSQGDQCLFSCSRSSKTLGEDPQQVKNVILLLLQQRNDSLHHLRICSMAYFLSVFSSLDFTLASVQRLHLYCSQHGSIGWGDKHAYWDFWCLLSMFSYWTVQDILYESTNLPCVLL